MRSSAAASCERAVSAVVPVRDHLGNHRVVAGRDAVTLLDTCVDADSVGQGKLANRADLRQKCHRVLWVYASFDRVSLRFGVQVEMCTRGDPKLPLDEIEIPDQLRDRVLDL